MSFDIWKPPTYQKVQGRTKRAAQQAGKPGKILSTAQAQHYTCPLSTPGWRDEVKNIKVFLSYIA